jgi:hypothetical protein
MVPLLMSVVLETLLWKFQLRRASACPPTMKTAEEVTKVDAYATL